MTAVELRKILVAGLKADGYRLHMDGPTGEYFTVAGHRVGSGTDHAIWIGWPFEGRPVETDIIHAKK
jgi:hypothetical protein